MARCPERLDKAQDNSHGKDGSSHRASDSPQTRRTWKALPRSTAEENYATSASRISTHPSGESIELRLPNVLAGSEIKPDSAPPSSMVAREKMGTGVAAGAMAQKKLTGNDFKVISYTLSLHITHSFILCRIFSRQCMLRGSCRLSEREIRHLFTVRYIFLL